jgi:hypothetical protein
MVSSKALLACAFLAAALSANARTYCCKDDGGHRVCGDVLPAQCLSRAYQEFNSQGVLSKEYEGPLTPEQRAQRQAETARKKAEQRKVADQDRRDRALLASYTSVKDIEAKRDRMVADLRAGLRLSEERYGDALARLRQLQEQAEKSRQKPIPESARIRIQRSEAEVATQQSAVESKKQDITEIQERFEQEKQRYLALTQKQQEDQAVKPANTTAPASSSTSR